MKQSILALSALAAAAQAVQPMFTNSAFDVEPNKPFTLTYNADGCASGCTIKLKTGSSGNLADYKEPLATGVTGTSFTVTPLADWPAGPLAFEISNSQDPPNYSVQFPYAGTGSAAPPSGGASSLASSASPGSMTQSSTSMATATAETDSAMTTEAAVTTGIPLVSNSSTSSTTMSSVPRNSTSSTSTRTGSSGSSATTVPSSGVDRVSASLALVAGVAAAMACLN